MDISMDIAIIGGGPAGLSAAIRAKEEGVGDVWVIERNGSLGGILNQCIHHGFGVHIFKEELTGPEYAQRLIDRAVELGVRFALNAMVIDLGLCGDKSLQVTYSSADGLVRAKSKAVILAMGCRERSRGALGIPGGRSAGVYTAGTAQAFVNMKGFMPGDRAVILGSGDIGLIMARRLTLEGAEVLGVFEIMPHAGGLKRNIAQCLNDYDIPLHLSYTVTRTVGNKRLAGVYVAKVDSRLQPDYNTEYFIPCDTFLLSVGLIPENELAKKIGVELSPLTGGAVVNSRLETNIPGVFACGNALHVHDIVDYVTQESYDAAYYAARYIRNEAAAGQTVRVVASEGVRYTVPAALVWEGPEALNLVSLRSDKEYAPGVITIQADNEVIRTIDKRIIIPSEMERLRFVMPKAAKEVRIKISGSEKNQRG